MQEYLEVATSLSYLEIRVFTKLISELDVGPKSVNKDLVLTFLDAVSRTEATTASNDAKQLIAGFKRYAEMCLVGIE